MRKRIIIPLIVLIAAGLSAAWLLYKRVSPPQAPGARNQNTGGPAVTYAPGNAAAPAVGEALPKTVALKVPFTPQAPTANWDQLHNEACEEASALMAGAYFGGNTDPTLTAEYAEREISKLVAWEEQNFGYHLDTTAAETAKMIEQVYGLKTRLVPDFNENDFKGELAQGHLVLVSTDGRLLGNPNYKRPGPPHHMLVVKGYNGGGIVTNDPGTKNGRNYTYDFGTINSAAGDWDHAKKAVDTAKKVAIIVWK
jgi:peptidase C39-like protein